MYAMIRTFRNSNGFTFIELMVTLSLLGVVIAGGFTFYHFADRSFMSGTEVADVQADVQLAMLRISEEVRLAHSLELISPDDVPMTVEDEDTHYLFTKDGSVFLRTVQSPPDRVILESSGGDTEYRVAFGPVVAEDGAIPDMLAITISTENPRVDYELASELQILNLRSSEVIGSNWGGAIMFTKEFSPEKVIPGGRDPRCPYGRFAFAPDSPELDSLRNFRDNVLAKNVLGRFVIRVYYASSPVVSALLDYQPIARQATTNFLRGLARVVIAST